MCEEMAQIKSTCMNACCSANGHQTNEQVSSFLTISSFSQAPSLSDQLYEDYQHTFNTFKTEQKSFKLKKKIPSRNSHCKGSTCIHLTSDNNSNKYHNKNKYVTQGISETSLDCPRHPKSCNQKLDINRLEESYWAQWKPGKCSDTRNDKLVESSAKISRMTSGSAKLSSDIPNIPFPNVNLDNYVQCKTCLKFIFGKRQKVGTCIHNYIQMDTETSDIESRRNNTFNEDDEYTTYCDDYSTDHTEADYTYGTTQSEAFISDVSHKCMCNAQNSEGSKKSENTNRASLEHSELSTVRPEINNHKSKDTIKTTHTEKSDINNSGNSYKDADNANPHIYKKEVTDSNKHSEKILYNNDDVASNRSISNLPDTKKNAEYISNYKSNQSLKYDGNQIHSENLYDPFKQAYNSGNSESQSTDEYNTNIENNLGKSPIGNYGQYNNEAEYDANGVTEPEYRTSIEHEDKNAYQQNKSNTVNVNENEQVKSKTPTKYDTNRSRSNTPNKYSSGNKTPKGITSNEYINNVPNRNIQVDNIIKDSDADIIAKTIESEDNSYNTSKKMASPIYDKATEDSYSQNLVAQESRPSYVYNINSVTTPRVLKGHSYPLKPLAKKEKRGASMARPASKNLYKYKK